MAATDASGAAAGHRGVPAWLDRAAQLTWRTLLVGVGAVVLAQVLLRLQLVVVPVFAGLLVATVLEPPSRWLQRHGWHPLPATVVVFVAGVLVAGGAVAAVSPTVAAEVEDLGAQIQQGYEDLQVWLVEGPLGLTEEQVDEYTSQGADRLGDLVSSSGGTIVSGATFVLEILAGLALTLVLAFFFVKDGRAMARWMIDHLPERHRDMADDMTRRSWETLGAYLRGSAVVGFVDAVLIGLGLWIVGVPLVVPLAVLTFVGAFFPLVGATVAGMLAVVVAFVNGGVVDALIVAAIVIGVQQVEGDVLAPVVMGRAVRLHPVVVLMVLTAGGVLAGILGAFLAVPVTALLTNLVDVGREHRSLDLPKPDFAEVRAAEARATRHGASARPDADTG